MNFWVIVFEARAVRPWGPRQDVRKRYVPGQPGLPVGIRDFGHKKSPRPLGSGATGSVIWGGSLYTVLPVQIMFVLIRILLSHVVT